MHALERRRKILEMLRDEPFLSVDQAQKVLDSSPATVRRDFADLSQQGLVVRGHGGIHRIDNAPIMGVLPFARRRVDHPEGKNRIAQAAADLLEDGQIAIIDGGTTTLNLAKFLSPHVRVITNSLPLALALNEPGNGRTIVPEVNMTGGYVYPRSEVLLGPQTVKSLLEYNADWTFISANGIMPDGIFNSNNLVVDTQMMMIQRAQRVAILVDQSKLLRPAMVKVCELTEVDYIITDGEPPKVLAEALAEAGAQLMVV